MVMKSLSIALLLCLLSITSCKKDPKSDKLDVQEEIVDTTTVIKDVIEKKEVVTSKKKKKNEVTKKKPKEQIIPVPKGAPSFNSVAARKYVRDYEAYVANYRKAVKAHADMDSFLKLSEASSSLTKQYRTLISTLSGNEIEKMSKYMEAKTKQIDALSKQL